MDFFKKTLPRKRALILPHYEKILNELELVRTYFANSKYVLAKNKLSELFVTISKSRKIIDSDYYVAILDFYEKFINNLFVAFAVMTVIKEKKQLTKLLDDIIAEISEKVAEIKNFIEADLINR